MGTSAAPGTSNDSSSTNKTPDISPDVVAAPDAHRDVDLTRDAILAAKDTSIERFYVPEWGGHVYLKTITGEQRDAFEASMLVDRIDPGTGKIVKQMTTENIRAKLLVQTLCDKDGNQLFTPDDVTALGQKSAAGLSRVYTRSSEINRVSNADVEELAGNSGSGATVSS